MSLHPDARKFLDSLDDFLLRHDTASAQVAAVITALRGPDKDEGYTVHGLKDKITLPIRRAALPKSALVNTGTAVGQNSKSVYARNMAFGTFVDVDLPKGIRVTSFTPASSNHFEHHGILAAEALGLAIDLDPVDLKKDGL